jgi:deazaflavin-dependent oxidoreductase (nitroreductase family)
MSPTHTIYHWMRGLNARMAANYRRGFGPTGVVLLLTTIGRKSGQPRLTPLQFEELDGDYYIASARGAQADWFKNLQSNPLVQVQLGRRCFAAQAEPVMDPRRLADFIELRLKRRPLMIRLIMHLFDGLPLRFNRADLEKIAAQKVLVILHPLEPR